MKRKLIGGMIAAAAVAGLLWVVPSPAPGQGKAFTPGKAWDGHADLQGIWQARNTAYVNLEAHTASLGMPAGTGVIIDPPDGKIPYKPEALAKRNQNRAQHVIGDPVNKCFMPGVPRVMTFNFPFQIFQSARNVIVVSEFAHVYRTIYTNDSKHLEGLDFWNGDSRGKWEGDTLVADVAGFNDETWFDQSGNYHSDALHVVERFTRTGPDVLTYEATIEDPKTFTRAWKIRMPLYRNTEANARLLEYECHSYLEDAAKGQ